MQGFFYGDSSQSKMNTLQNSEWVLVSVLLIFLASFVFIARYHEHRRAIQLQQFSWQEARPISVSIEGAVLKPGSYLVASGTLLGEALKKSRPKRFANFRELDLDQVLESDCSLIIEELSTLKIKVSSDVNGIFKELEVPPGTRICDLRECVEELFAKPKEPPAPEGARSICLTQTDDLLEPSPQAKGLPKGFSPRFQEVDKNFLKKRRLLRDGEVLEIPAKKVAK